MTTKIETLTDVERHQLPLYTPYLGSKALRIIDAHAAERAALTEQVAQLTRERDQIKVRLAVSRGCRKVAKAEVARLTEALAAAERRGVHFDEQCAANLARAEAAERDRDAARALVRDWSNSALERLYERTAALLSGQPAAPAHTWCDVCGGDGVEHTPTGTKECRKGPHISAQHAAPATTATEARVRELEAEVQRLKERNAQLVVSSQVRSYEAALDAQERAEKALFQLRERVARAVTWLVSAQTAGFRFQANDAVKCALEALRGS